MEKSIIHFLILLSLLSVTMFSCKKQDVDIPDRPGEPQPDSIYAPPDLRFYVVGYFPSYRTVAEYPDRMFKMFTVINYAFFSVTDSGTINVVNQTKFDSVYKKAKTNGAKVFININNADNFKNMAATVTARHNFVVDVMTRVRALQVDGVDIDWEYPRTTDGTDTTFAALMKELSDSLHKNGKYYLSAAITPGRYAGAVRDGIRDEVFAAVDFFNIMIYDDFSTTTPYKHHSNMALFDYSTDYWLNTRGLPKEKCIAGIPAYGRPSGITQTGTALPYATILKQGGSPLSDSAVVTAGGYIDYTIYYNGMPTVKQKAARAKEIANGIMFWEIGQDHNGDLSLIKAACDTLGRTY